MITVNRQEVDFLHESRPVHVPFGLAVKEHIHLLPEFMDLTLFGKAILMTYKSLKNTSGDSTQQQLNTASLGSFSPLQAGSPMFVRKATPRTGLRQDRL